MPRSAPSKADRELIAAVSAAGVTVSATQLERWRKAGLLPRASQAWRGKYGSVCALPEGSVELATSLGQHARRGRGWVDLALLTWLDGAPVKDAMLNRAVRAATRGILQLALETLEKERAASSVPEGMELDPTFETAEALARLAMRGSHRARLRVDKELQARLRAAGYEVPEQPLRDLLTVTWTHAADESNPMDPEEAARWAVAVGMRDKTSSEMGKASTASWLLSRGLQELTGVTAPQLVNQGLQQVVDGTIFVSRDELDAAREDLVAYLDLLGWTQEDRLPTTSTTWVSHFVGCISMLWALICRQLPRGTGVRYVVRAGLQTVQQLPSGGPALAA